ncbi:MAG: hypothetical protein PHQ23_05925, partial [Candidatus Wallbacteria bacterium]|nr:hypothetical protein [Candidatus Wallbacteria bacterium]
SDGEARLYLAGSYHPPEFPGIQLSNNLIWTRQCRDSGILANWGLEARLGELPAYLLLEIEDKFQSGSNIYNLGLRFFGSSIVCDLVFEDDPEFSEEKLGLNLAWRY